ncbi:hypothetical protein FKM82_013793 [Ascaphus truei]
MHVMTTPYSLDLAYSTKHVHSINPFVARGATQCSIQPTQETDLCHEALTVQMLLIDKLSDRAVPTTHLSQKCSLRFIMLPNGLRVVKTSCPESCIRSARFESVYRFRTLKPYK